MKLRLATRKSALALVQSRWVAERLKEAEPGLEVELVEMTTRGDELKDVSLTELGGKGLFVSEIERALVDNEADVAVHSMKDLPAQLTSGVAIAAVPAREDPRDTVLTRDGADLMDLVAGSKIGTNSARRTVQLRRLRNDLAYAMLRGNVDTRLSKLEAGDYDAIVLAAAGLRRLGLSHLPQAALSVEQSIPAIGQGALAVQTRADDRRIRELVSRIEDRDSRVCVDAERALLAGLGGDCTTPLAGHARLLDGGRRLRLDGMVGSLSDDRRVDAGTDDRYGGDAGEAVRMGRDVAEQLLSAGAGALIEEARAGAGTDPRSAPR